MSTKLSKEDIHQIQERINPYVHHTPVMSSRLINELSGGDLFFKCENFQRMGAFKMRGASNAILSLNEEQKSRGVVAHSSGNFAQAVALSAKMMGVKAYIVMPTNAPKVKKQAVESYGGIITECEPTMTARQSTTDNIAEKTGASPLHPSNQDEVILGNSTIATEFLNEVPDLERIIVPVGGGGMIAGVSLACEALSPLCEVIGAEPAEADDAKRSLERGEIVLNESSSTIADGLRTHLGDRNFPIIKRVVKRIITVEEDEIIAAMKLVWERMKLVIEPSAGVGVAVALREKELVAQGKTGVIICGGNVDLENLPW